MQAPLLARFGTSPTAKVQVIMDFTIAMSELINSPLFLMIAAILAILLVIAIVKGAIRLLIWVVIIAVILIGLGIMTQGELRHWFENLLKTVK